MEKPGRSITFDAVAREAQVSRSWLYNQTDLRAEIERLRARRDPATPDRPVLPDRQRASDASLLRRLTAATDRIKHLEAENNQLRDALAIALDTRRTTISERSRQLPRHAEQEICRDHRPLLRGASATVLTASALVTAILNSSARDNGR